MSEEQHFSGFQLVTFVVILQSHNVILAEIITKLHFDNFDQTFMQVFQAVLGTQRNVDGVSASHRYNSFTHRDSGRTIDHRPMLTAVLVALQGQTPRRLYDNPLHLESRLFIQHVKGTPWPCFAIHLSFPLVDLNLSP